MQSCILKAVSKNMENPEKDTKGMCYITSEYKGGYRPCKSCDFTLAKLSNLHKIGKHGKEIGEKSGKLSTKSELSHT